MAAFAPIPAQAAEGNLRVPAGAEVVSGRYLVLLHPGTESVDTTAAALAARHGGTVEHVYRAALRGFSVAATDQQARRLAADPAVLLVEADTIVRGSGLQSLPPWQLDRIDQRSTVLDDEYAYPDSSGNGVTAYVMDTGIRTSHHEFDGRAQVGFDGYDDGWNGQDCSTTGHGTHVAGIIGGTTYGVAKQVELVSVRVLPCENYGPNSVITAGVDWITQHAAHPAVVNMSLGARGSSTVLETAVRNSVISGITYVIAAGNDNVDACTFTPAKVANAITVGASDPMDERARNWGQSPTAADAGSNWGTCVDLFAPGQAIESAHNATDDATVTLFGTSMAAPHVAGAAALLLADNPALTPVEVTNTLLAQATAGVLSPTDLGTGSPNKLLHTNPTPPADCTVSDDTWRPVPDLGETSSTVEVTDCPGTVAETASVHVRAEHPFRGDLSVTLVAPDGTERVLKEADGTDVGVDLDTTYPLAGMSTLDANGRWRLVVRDNFGFDEGALLGWTLTLR
ncbi:S8 family peptidase [Actinophytocola glycyrrhizae]|uniref:S8 family serine peptidase n=1 Tax=Actinophytocola glycyrrhizae TaxID=2044873 RepID=A0ABV9RXC6_9PSEU